MDKPNGSHAETLLFTNPDMIRSVGKKLRTEIQQLSADPESASKLRETANMPAPRPAPAPGETEPTTDSDMFRVALKAATETARSEGRGVTRLQLSIMTGIIGVLWMVTVALTGMIWSDMKGRVGATEATVQKLAVDVSGLQQKNAETDRRLERIEVKQDGLGNKLDEIKDELRKPK